MDRRSFLRSGAVSASGIAVSAKPALAAATDRGGSPLYAMDDYLARMDEGLARVREWSILDGVPDFEGDAEAVNDLGRNAFTALYMTAMFSDLPVEEQVRPEVQERMWAVQDTMDTALDQMTSFLATRTTDDFANVRRRLGEEPEVLERVIEIIDLEAVRTGISDHRRRKTRAMIENVAWRMAEQPPELLVNEYLDKVQRTTESNVSEEARARWLMSKVGEKAFWHAARQEASLRQRRISRGLRNMGIGAVIFLGGLLLVAAGDTDGDFEGVVVIGAITGTVGSIWFLVGFVQLLIGAGTSGGS